MGTPAPTPYDRPHGALEARPMARALLRDERREAASRRVAARRPARRFRGHRPARRPADVGAGSGDGWPLLARAPRRLAPRRPLRDGAAGAGDPGGASGPGGARRDRSAGVEPP